ncbi:twin-arginine translocase TatA/TatE family subunit [Pseudonocardia parietis]|nr:twin-arginine translocase TatA/TatE family subunit [Pseudonocardia parietis]
MTPPGPTQLLIVLLVLVLLFGAKKLPDLARSVGRSSRILKSELNANDRDDRDDRDDHSNPGEVRQPSPGARAPREPER